MLRFPLPVLLAVAFLLPAVPAAAQSIPPVGTDATFDVATWNIEWFGDPSNGPSDDERQRANVRTVIEQSGVDLWALQEIDDPADFALLLEELGDDYDGFYRDNASSGVTQRLAFVYRPAVVQVRRIEQLLTPQYDYAFAFRPPLKIDVDVTLPDTSVSLSVITVHMKARSDAESYERRAEAAIRLKNRIDIFYGSARLIVLGDFNDELGRSISGGGRTSPYTPFLEDQDDYRFLTLPMDAANVPTYCSSGTCSSGSTLDHILITNELFDAFVDGAAGRYTDVLDAFPGFTSTTSDHLPVYARFAFEPSTVAVEAGAPGRGFALQPVYPNPVRGGATLRFTLDRPGAVRVEVYDLLGRRVAVAADGFRAAGAHTAAFDASALPEGVYLVRLRAGAQTAVRRVVRLR